MFLNVLDKKRETRALGKGREPRERLFSQRGLFLRSEPRLRSVSQVLNQQKKKDKMNYKTMINKKCCYTCYKPRLIHKRCINYVICNQRWVKVCGYVCYQMDSFLCVFSSLKAAGLVFVTGFWRQTASLCAPWMAPGETAAPPWCPAPLPPPTFPTWRRTLGSCGDELSTSGKRCAKRRRSSWR